MHTLSLKTNMKKIVVLFTSLILIQFYGTSQQKEPNFKAGEEINYIVSYNWGFIWIDVGEAKFSVKEKNSNQNLFMSWKLGVKLIRVGIIFSKSGIITKVLYITNRLNQFIL